MATTKSIHNNQESFSTGEPAGHSADKGYFAIPVAILVGLPELRCDIYFQHAVTSRKVLYRSATTNINIEDDEKLKQRNVRHLYLKSADREKYEQSVKTALKSSPADPLVSLALTVEHHRDNFEVALRSSTPLQVVEAAEKISHDVLRVINQNDFAVGEALSLLSHDKCTFQHSCNVSIYSATLAKRMGLSDSDLTLLITGGMVHDLGKRRIPAFILRKPGRLDDRERELIRQHPVLGFRELAALGQLKWSQLMMVYQHHEWMSGAGYPSGVGDDEIHLWARICAVADVFDALTANRPYREGGHGTAALDIMRSEVGHFDNEILQLWAEIVGL